MTARARNLLIAGTCALVALLALAAFMLVRSAVVETRDAAKSTITGVGDKVSNKIDTAADAIKADYGKAKSIGKDKYEQWRESRRQSKLDSQQSPMYGPEGDGLPPP